MGMASKSDSTPKMVQFASMFISEMLDDIHDMPPAIIETYIKVLSGMMYWIAEGTEMPDCPLPEDFKRDS